MGKQWGGYSDREAESGENIIFSRCSGHRE